MDYEITRVLASEWMPNAIAFMALICGIGTLWFGFYQLKQTIENELRLTQKAVMLNQAEKLPETMQKFLREASLTLAYKVVYDNSKTSKNRQNFEEHNIKQSQLLDELTKYIVAYGSEKAIAVFGEFYYPLRNYVNKTEAVKNVHLNEWIVMYYSLPLLMSVVKFDVTGELVNPSVMLEFLMPEFKTISPSIMKDLVVRSDELIEKYELDAAFKWRN